MVVNDQDLGPPDTSHSPFLDLAKHFRVLNASTIFIKAHPMAEGYSILFHILSDAKLFEDLKPVWMPPYRCSQLRCDLAPFKQLIFDSGALEAERQPQAHKTASNDDDFEWDVRASHVAQEPDWRGICMSRARGR